MSKITKEELKTLTEQEQKKAAIRNDLGVLEVQKHSLLHIYAEVEIEQIELKKQLEESYGKVNVNLKTGEYELIEDEKKKEEKSDWGIDIKTK
jgi:hypothetical protein|tara:strand:- start:12513 stop:12791 length:279 start_codon:yes stop_codon:yes gene_type:complete